MEQQNQQPNQQPNQTLPDVAKQARNKRIKIVLLALAAIVFVIAGGVFLLSNNSFIDDYRYELNQTLNQRAEEKLYACTSDTECVLVQNGWCSTIVAIRKDKKSEWEEEDRKRTEQARQARQTCKTTSREYLEIENFQGVCEQSRCKAKFIGEASQDIDASDWQTYRNEEFGFEVKYPSVLSVSEGSNDILLFFKDSSERLTMEMRLTSAPGIRCHPDAKEDTCKVLSIDEGIEVTIRSFDIAPTEATIQLSDEVALYFVLRCENNKYEDDTPEGVSFCIISPERRVLFNQILSTFRFAPTPKPVSSTRVAREITITAKKNQWRFVPEEFEVNQGDTVVLTVLNEDDYDHGIAIDQFGISQRIPANSITKVEFMATQAGDFPFYSSVPSGGGIVDGEKRTYYDMVGKIHVRSLIPETK